jgi:hypothetical protein
MNIESPKQLIKHGIHTYIAIPLPREIVDQLHDGLFDRVVNQHGDGKLLAEDKGGTQWWVMIVETTEGAWAVWYDYHESMGICLNDVSIAAKIQR